MTFLQLIRYVLSLPMNLVWLGETREEQKEVQLYDFVHIAFFTGGLGFCFGGWGLLGSDYQRLSDWLSFCKTQSIRIRYQSTEF